MDKEQIFAIITGNKYFPEHIGKVVEIELFRVMRDSAGIMTTYYSTIPELLSDDGKPIIYREEQITILDHELETHNDSMGLFFSLYDQNRTADEYYRRLNQFCDRLNGPESKDTDIPKKKKR